VSKQIRRQSSSLRRALRAALGAGVTLRETRDELRILRILREGFFNPSRPIASACAPASIPSARPPAEPALEETHTPWLAI
jgi:hypothetical protein